MIGTDGVLVPTMKTTFLDLLWAKALDPEKSESVDVLIVWKIVDPDKPGQTLFYHHHWISLATLPAAVDFSQRELFDGAFIQFKKLAEAIG